MIYFDNNATTNMPASVCQALISHCNMGNPSASYKSAKKAKQILDLFRQEIANRCEFVVANEICGDGIDGTVGKKECREKPQNISKEYYIIFTSGASESNTMIITRVCDSYMARGLIAHLVVSSIEHKSIIECVSYHVGLGRATVSYVEPTSSGHILATNVDALITPNTALVCVMAANNETGAVNDIRAIGKVAHNHKVPFYTDSVQSFGKHGISPIRDNVDGFSVSFHKLCGPVGCGLLILKREWIEGYGIKSLIFGTQNYGLRGGTENVPAIAASRCAYALTMKNRLEKNKSLFANKCYIINEICKYIPHRTYEEYLIKDNKAKPELEIVFFDCSIFTSKAQSMRDYLPNTIFLSIVKRSEPAICNSKFKEAMDRNGVIISVGSACNTASPKASHVLYALGADDLIRSGALRISLGDMNTKNECILFVKKFILQIKSILEK